ncbi:phosphoglycerol transferase I [Luteimonas composti]|uniref:Phosphoglycerol transferase I n=1 Tax=Luteimonas composti TaxID=398257 RepID=A0ABT6MS80_9GAMM|nr:phosphoglycerol transferase I [Luteimonas composti]MDH7453511.1 phosphoglycerol transferase I [Luteimonas composti]
MTPILLLSLLLLAYLLVASPRLAWLKAGLLSALLLALSVWWLVDRMSGNGIDAATLYHLQAGLQGAGVGDFGADIARFLGLALLSLLPLALVPLLRGRLRGFRLRHSTPAVSAGFAATLALAFLASPLWSDLQRLRGHFAPADADGVAAQYQVPGGELPRRPNIVWIYAESLERTYLDESVFPGLMPHLARLVKEGLDFRDIASPEGGGWTIAGLVTSQCGIPLTAARGDENSLGRMSDFLPGAHCLGDFLKGQGYRNLFLGGADANFAAKGRFLEQHGYDEVRDLAHYREAGIEPRHFSNWGLHDDVLLEDAFDTFLALSAAGAPFMLNALTMDTHHPAGHLPEACRDVRYESPLGDIGLLHAIKCSDLLISQLVERIRASDYADDTLIVLASDHLAMPNHLSHVLKDMRRENLLLFLGPGIEGQQLAVPGTTLDSGATLLSLIDPDRTALGFGRSLLAPDAAPGASVAALGASGAEYAPYLAYARSLWTGGDTRTLQVDDGQIRIGLQQVHPPVMIEYEPDWTLGSITMEDAPRQFGIDDPANVRAYVDRCTAFDDDALSGEWCALLVDGQNNRRLFADADLQRGVRVDAPLEAAPGPRPRPRRAVWLGHETEVVAGQYQLRVRPREWPTHPFWLEAVASDGRVVAREWVQPEGRRPTGPIRLQIGVDETITDLEFRAWLDWAEYMELDSLAMVRTAPRSRG